MLASVGLVVPWLVLAWLRPFGSDVANTVITDGLAILLLLYTLALLLQRIVTVDESDFDVICGAVAVYLLLGVVWAVWYRLIETLAPNSFSIAGAGGSLGWNDYLYFSFVTLTTLGYGDVLPVSPIARIWATLEAVAGVLYIALLISRLVNLYRR